MKTYIIAEAGINHNGDIDLAYKMVDEAKKAGADCVKFQTFKSSNLVTKKSLMADYQRKNLGKEVSQLEMLKKYELPYSAFSKISAYCKSKKIDFMSTPFDLESIDFLESIYMHYWKIPSGEITNLPYLEKIAKLKKPLIVSTGMCTMNDIENALDILRKFTDKEIILLHCTTEYPTPFKEVNINAMIKIKDHFNIDVGYSDHTIGIVVPIMAVSLGARVIEKHFTLDKNMSGPDHAASIDTFELMEMVKSIRIVEESLGVEEKKPTDSEMKNILISRKSIVASKQINTGEIFSPENITTKRPGTGINPMKWYEVIGKKAKKNYEIDDMIELES